MSVHDLNSLKQAKILTQEIAEIRLILKDSFKKLHPFKKYISVKPILNEILSAECQLKTASVKYKTVLKTKGKL